MKDLPEELVEIIVDYLGRKLSSLLMLRTINREWKEFVEHSLFWFDGKLIISAPRLYLEIADLHASETQDAFVIQIDEEIYSIPQDQFRFRVVQDSYSIIRTQNRYDEAAVICSKFLQKLRQTNDAWHFYMEWAPFCKKWKTVSEQWLSSVQFIFLSFLSFSLLVLSVYLLSDINYTDNLSISQIFGFTFIYLNGLFYSGSLALYILGKLCFGYLLRFEDISARFWLTSRESMLLFSLATLISGTISIAVLQLTLSSQNSNKNFIFVSLPMWFLQGITALIAVRYLGSREDHRLLILYMITFITVPLTITLVALHFQSTLSHSGISSLGNALLPLLLPGISVFYLACVSLHGSAMLIHSYFKGESIVNHSSNLRIGLRLFVNFMKTLSVVFLFLLMLNLLEKGYRNRLGLSTSLTTILLFIICIQVGFYFSRFDSKFL